MKTRQDNEKPNRFGRQMKKAAQKEEQKDKEMKGEDQRFLFLFFKKVRAGQLKPVMSALWEAEAGRSPEFRSSTPA